MSHGQSPRYPESRATQPGARSVASPATSRGGLRAGTNLFHLPSPGVSLFRTSTTPKGAGARWGSQDRFHGEALSDSGRPTPGLCRFDRADLERPRQPCCFEVTEPRAKTWLKGRRMAKGWPFGWNIGLIACWPKSSLKLMNCWYPNGEGWLIAPLPVARRF